MWSKVVNLCKILNGIEIKNKGHQNNSVFVSITGNEQLFTLLLCEVSHVSNCSMFQFNIGTSVCILEYMFVLKHTFVGFTRLQR